MVYPLPNPRFGTLVSFDDEESGSPVIAGNYSFFGVESITEVSSGLALELFDSSQS